MSFKLDLMNFIIRKGMIETSSVSRILNIILSGYSENDCRFIYLFSVPLTKLLNDDITLNILSFCTFDDLFSCMIFVNKKFYNLVMKLETMNCMREYDILSVHTKGKTYVVTKKRKLRSIAEDAFNFVGPFNNLHEVIMKADNNSRILILHDDWHVIGDSTFFSEQITKNIEIIGIGINNNIRIIIDNIQEIGGSTNVKFENIKLMNAKSELCFLSVGPYSKLMMKNCVLDVWRYDEDVSLPFQLGEYGTTHQFVNVGLGGCVIIDGCLFKNVENAIKIDNKANTVIIKNCIFHKMIQQNKDTPNKACIVISDDECKSIRRRILKNHPDKDLLIRNPSLLCIECTNNIFKEINMKYPFMESLYYDTSNRNNFIIQYNYLDDKNDVNDPNKIYSHLLPGSPFSDHDDE